jgi:hypothetical protein
MKKALIILCALVNTISLRGQTYYQDPAVNDAYVNPNPVTAVGSEFDMVFELGNNGFDPISGADANNQMSFTVSLSKCDPSSGGSISSIGLDALSGPALTYFNITYDAVNNVFTGQQKTGVVIDAFAAFDLVIHAEVTMLSDYADDNSIGGHLVISPDEASGSFNNLANDNGEALTHTTSLTTLPDIFNSFTAVAPNCDNIVTLNWKTVTEEDNCYFDIERSSDAITFNVIKTIPGKNHVEGNSYNTVLRGQDVPGYYRLKMTGVDGLAFYSPVRSINTKCVPSRMTLGPNPVINNKTTVKGMANQSTIRVFDANGRQLSSLVTTQSSQDIDFSGYAKGIYIVSVIDYRGSVRSFKISKL